MACQEVYSSLVEVFPMTDTRFLRAVAYEHSTDINMAIDYILSVDLPSLGWSKESSSDLNARVTDHPIRIGRQEVQAGPSQNVVIGQLERSNDRGKEKVLDDGVDIAVTGFSTINYGFSSPDPKISETVPVSLGTSTPIILNHADADYSMFDLQGCNEGRGRAIEVLDNVCDASRFVVPGQEVCIMDCSSASDPKVCETLPISGMSTSSLLKHGDAAGSMLDLKGNVSDTVCAGINESLSACSCNDVVNLENDSVLPEYKEDFDKAVDLANEGEGMYGSSGDFSNAKSVNVSDNSVTSPDISSLLPDSNFSEMIFNYAPHATMTRENFSSHYQSHELQSNSASENNADKFFEASTTVDNHDFQNANVNVSGQVVSIEFLEDFIVEARNNKKIMLSAMEAARSKLKEVEIEEAIAYNAKELAYIAGQNTMMKAKELRLLLDNANEANNMHAGEIYGEKSILATESRELQSRLLSLSNERDKSLGVIEEIHKTLEARLDVAKHETAAAEEEKLQREKHASMAISELENMMESVVQETKQLQQAAEANIKLREFLMDRGRSVDILQGEIAVVCEDILTLKERVEGRLPSSMFSSTSTSLASSLSSSASTRRSVFPIGAIRSTERAEEAADTESERSESGSHDGGSNSEDASSEKRKADDWEVV